MGPLVQRTELCNILSGKYGKGLYHHARNYNFLVAVDGERHEYMFDIEKLREHIHKIATYHSNIAAKIEQFEKRIKNVPFNIWYPWPIDCINGKFFKSKEKLKHKKIWVDINLYAYLLNANPLNARSYQSSFQKIALSFKDAGIPPCPFPSVRKFKKVADIKIVLRREQKYKIGNYRLLKKIKEYKDELW